jgi:hypothetical protein
VNGKGNIYHRRRSRSIRLLPCKRPSAVRRAGFICTWRLAGRGIRRCLGCGGETVRRFGAAPIEGDLELSYAGTKQSVRDGNRRGRPFHEYRKIEALRDSDRNFVIPFQFGGITRTDIAQAMGRSLPNSEAPATAVQGEVGRSLLLPLPHPPKPPQRSGPRRHAHRRKPQAAHHRRRRDRDQRGLREALR